MGLKNKSIIVTGAASGIGHAIASDLTQRGGEVITVDLRPTDVGHRHVQADISDPASIDAVLDRLPDGCHGLVNVAGVPPSSPPQIVLAVNAKGLERLTRGVAPKLAEGGSIVNIASSAGSGWASSGEVLRAFDDVPFETGALAGFAAAHGLDRDGASYFFSKEFVVSWTMRNRWAWRDRGIRVNSVSPGPVETPVLQDFIDTLPRAQRMMDLMDRPGQPTDIAPVVAFLLSDESGWIRGSNIAVDGGMTSMLAMKSLGMEP